MEHDIKATNTIQTTHQTYRSFYTRVLHSLIRPFKPRLVSSEESFPAGSQRLIPHAKARKLCTIEQRQVDDMYVYDMLSKTAKAEAVNRRIYYFAGGGWKAPPSLQHWKFCAEICQRLPDTAVTVVSSPLAPDCPATIAIPRLKLFCNSVLKQSEELSESVVFGGDSSGGNLVLCLTLQTLMEDPESRRPKALLIISPAVDLQQMQNEGIYAQTNRFDPVLSIDSHNEETELWCGKQKRTEPWISPIEADVSVLANAGVKLIAVTGGYDILTPDAMRFKAKCEAAGVAGHWLHWEQQMHCFPLAFIYGLPESVQSKNWLVDRLAEV